MQKKVKLGVIGGGFMAQAIVNGAIQTGFLNPDDVIVSEPDESKRMLFLQRGINACNDNRMICHFCDYLLLAIKPQVFPSVAEELREEPLPVLISIMAGKTIASILLATGAKHVARIMPNLPCSVGAGMSGIDDSMLSEQDRIFTRGLFSSVGEIVEVEERLLNAVTGISGSGPAYVYLFYQSLVQAGMGQGLSETQASKLAFQTIMGGMEMLRSTGSSPEALIAAVSSKGGTTVAALNSFEADDFMGSVKRAVDAAVRRSEELSK